MTPRPPEDDRLADRYGSPSRWRALAIGLPIAVLLLVVGGYWTLLSWGVWGDQDTSGVIEIAGPALAGFGVALAYVCLRPRH